MRGRRTGFAGYAAAMPDPASPAWSSDLPWLAELCLAAGPAAGGDAKVLRTLGAREGLARQFGHGQALGVDMVQAAVDDLLAAGALPQRASLQVVARAEGGFVADVTAGVARACRAHGALLVVAAAALGEPERVEVQLAGALCTPAAAAPPVPGDVVVALRARGPTDGDLPFLLARAQQLGRGPADRLVGGETVAEALLAPRGAHLAMLHDPLTQGWPGVRRAVDDGTLAAAVVGCLPPDCTVAWDFAAWRPPAPFRELLPDVAALEGAVAHGSCGCGFVVVAAESHAERWLQHCAAWNEPATRIGRIVARDPPS